jgi:NAD(P)-dependent dehydrogenase (short-subunit alcohol dehydrogenase family)
MPYGARDGRDERTRPGDGGAWSRLDGIDLLVNNAGIGMPGGPAEPHRETAYHGRSEDGRGTLTMER